MQDTEKLQILYNRQFECLKELVFEWLRDWTIWKNHPLYVLFLQSESQYLKIMERVLNTNN